MFVVSIITQIITTVPKLFIISFNNIHKPCCGCSRCFQLRIFPLNIPQIEAIRPDDITDRQKTLSTDLDRPVKFARLTWWSLIPPLTLFLYLSSDDVHLCIVVLRSSRTLSVKSPLYERSLYGPVHCGDSAKVACLWITGKTTASLCNYTESLALVQQKLL